jgi:putative transposase
MLLDEFGEIGRNFWAEITEHFKYVGIDGFSVMPNHIHGILIVQEHTVGNACMRSLHR